MTTHDAEKIKMPFGHYKDLTLGELVQKDLLYLDHMAKENIRGFDYLKEALAVLVEKHADFILAALHRGEKPRLFNESSAAVHAPRPVQMKMNLL